MESGIYIIKNIIDNKIYIGKSVYIKTRIINHRSALKNNRHYNKYLQRAYDKYGMDNFIFEVLEKCTEEQLPVQEGIWINTFQSNLPEYGYNIEYISEDGVSNKVYDRRIIEKEPNYLLINLETGEHTFYRQVSAIYKDINVKLNNKLTDIISNQKKFYKGETIRKKSYKNLVLINTEYHYDLDYIRYVHKDQRLKPKHYPSL